MSSKIDLIDLNSDNFTFFWTPKNVYKVVFSFLCPGTNQLQTRSHICVWIPD